MKYKTKPKDVSVIQYTGDNYEKVVLFTGGRAKEDADDDVIYLVESDVTTVVHSGDWIINYGGSVSFGKWIFNLGEDEFEVYSDDDFNNNFEPV